VTRIKLASEDCVFGCGRAAVRVADGCEGSGELAYLAEYVKKENGARHSEGTKL